MSRDASCRSCDWTGATIPATSRGNAPTYGETKTLLLHGLTVGGKPLRDYLEVRGHNDAIFKLEDIVRGHHPLTEHAIREMHQLILGREPFGIPAQTSDGLRTARFLPRYPEKQ